MQNEIYESIAYNKDYISGEVITKKKIKKNKGIKGKATLQLFDAKTKELIKEAYTENLIPELYFKDTFIGHFVQGIMGVGSSRQCNNHTWFEYLYLTDSDKPEHGSEQRIMGNVIGYAHRNTGYSGSENNRGTINRSETKYEVTDSKVKLNFVFDFPTNAANGAIESIYWAEADVANKDYFYLGAPINGREDGDTNYIIYNNINPRRYYAAFYGFIYALTVKFTSPTKGWLILDGKNTTLTQSSYLQFPENLKGHFIMVPFDMNVNDIILWEQAVRLLNADGEPLKPISTDVVKKYDGLSAACPYYETVDNVVFVGYNLYSISSDYYIRIYKWSKVGVLLSQVDINMTQSYKDTSYNTLFSYRMIGTDGIFVDGCIDIVGTTQRTDSQFNETVYTSKLIRINASGQIIQDLNIKPKIGNSKWFATKGMDSGNIERRCYVSNIYRSKNKLYLYYTSVQGGNPFWQVISTAGNLIDPYRMYFSFNGGQYYMHNILNTDRWVARYSYQYNNYTYLLVSNALTSRPIGAHTKLAQPVEKTEANTMKVQYMFEIDLLTYGEDYY